MSHNLPPLNALRAFECAARHLSFKLAAEELHVTPTAISHQIRALEEHLGVSLFHRLTRALALTQAGEQLLPGVKDGLECFARAVEGIHPRSSTTQITVVSPPLFSVRWLLPALQGFSLDHPDVEFRVVSSLSAIDGKSSDNRAPDEGLVARIRFTTGQFPGQQADRLFTPAFTPICSPSLLKGTHPLLTPADLRYHPLIHDESIPRPDERPNWVHWLEKAEVSAVDVARGPRFSDSALAIDAAIAGLGVALSFRAMVRKEVSDGRLVIPFEISFPARETYYLITPAGERPPALEAFRRWILERAAEEEAYCRLRREGC